MYRYSYGVRSLRKLEGEASYNGRGVSESGAALSKKRDNGGAGGKSYRRMWPQRIMIGISGIQNPSMVLQLQRIF